MEQIKNLSQGGCQLTEVYLENHTPISMAIFSGKPELAGFP